MSEKFTAFVLIVILSLSVFIVGKDLVPGEAFDWMLDFYDNIVSFSLTDIPDGKMSIDWETLGLPSVASTPIWVDTTSFDGFSLYPGDVAYFVEGTLHNSHGPAIERLNGEIEYWLWGVKFSNYSEYLKIKTAVGDVERKVGTVNIKFNGRLFEMTEPVINNPDGPAISTEAGSVAWVQHGVLSRSGGPAVEYFNGTKWYLTNGRFHRLDGPAIIKPGRFHEEKEYWINGKQLPEEQFYDRSEKMKGFEPFESPMSVENSKMAAMPW